ncbi:MAG: hypothetical protein CM15mP46_4100 [Alphaproteobacteria bacterium]|nr:MAG: hypothetical protein CM15mP46_4100 [Alphaproteobacteria bacterium]
MLGDRGRKEMIHADNLVVIDNQAMVKKGVGFNGGRVGNKKDRAPNPAYPKPGGLIDTMVTGPHARDKWGWAPGFFPRNCTA